MNELLSHKTSSRDAPFSSHSLSRLSAFLTLSVVLWCACDSTDGPPSQSCWTQPIAKELKRVLVWGEETPDQWVANGGAYMIGEVWWPIWYADDKILVYTRTVEQGESIRGIFEVAIDPQTFGYKGYTSWAFPYQIRDYDYDATTGDFLVAYQTPPVELHLVRAHADGANLAIADTVLSSSWYPEFAKFTDDGDVVCYARDPATSVWGFYFASSGATGPDSLLYAIQFSYLSDARGFDIGGGILCFGESDPANHQAMIKVIDIPTGGSPREVVALEGAFASARVNQSGNCAVISQEDLRIPGDVVYLLNLSTGQATKFDCQIHRCYAPVANFGMLNPAGNAFAFSGAGFNGEGGRLPSQLWVRKSAACP